MSVYIKGMEIPKKQVYVILNPNGLVEVLDENNVLLEEYQSVPVPPHGRLIDADALMKRMWEETDCMISVPATFVRDASTIIEAEEGET